MDAPVLGVRGTPDAGAPSVPMTYPLLGSSGAVGRGRRRRAPVDSGIAWLSWWPAPVIVQAAAPPKGFGEGEGSDVVTLACGHGCLRIRGVLT